MRGYLAIFKIRMKTLFQYRAAAFAAICTQLFWGIVTVMIYRAFYAGTGTGEPITLGQTITFIWLGQSLLRILPWTTDKEIEAQVKNGNVVYELVRPLHLYELWFARSFAQLTVPTLMRCAPVFFIAGLFFGLGAPVSLAAGLAFCTSVIIAFFLSSAIVTLVMISLFWTISGEGIQRMMPHMTVLLSGMVVPLPLFPGWMQPFLNLQPFRGVMDIPCRLYTGVIPTTEAFYYFGFQIAWTLFFIWVGKHLIHKAMKKFVIQGG
jgi:ABC-2 type transport system permease protein